jgi:hypothetical protein
MKKRILAFLILCMVLLAGYGSNSNVNADFEDINPPVDVEPHPGG